MIGSVKRRRMKCTPSQSKRGRECRRMERTTAVRKDKTYSDGENSTRREESDDKGEEGLRETVAGNYGGDMDGFIGCQTEQNRDEVLNNMQPQG